MQTRGRLEFVLVVHLREVRRSPCFSLQSASVALIQLLAVSPRIPASFSQISDSSRKIGKSADSMTLVRVRLDCSTQNHRKRLGHVCRASPSPVSLDIS